MSAKDKLKRHVCALIGHSNIVDTCFGYVHCGRCEQLLGDTLGGAYRPRVIIGHDCEECRTHYEQMTWKDKLLVPYPLFESNGNKAWRISRETGRNVLEVLDELEKQP